MQAAKQDIVEKVTRIVERNWSDLKQQPRRVSWEDVPIPFSPILEAAVTVRKEEIRSAVLATVERNGGA